MSQSDRVYCRFCLGALSLFADGSREPRRRKRGAPGRAFVIRLTAPFGLFGFSMDQKHRPTNGFVNTDAPLRPRSLVHADIILVARGPVVRSRRRRRRRRRGLFGDGLFCRAKTFAKARPARSLAREIPGEGLIIIPSSSLCHVQSELICFINWGRSVCFANFRGIPAEGRFVAGFLGALREIFQTDRATVAARPGVSLWNRRR